MKRLTRIMKMIYFFFRLKKEFRSWSISEDNIFSFKICLWISRWKELSKNRGLNSEKKFLPHKAARSTKAGIEKQVKSFWNQCPAPCHAPVWMFERRGEWRSPKRWRYAIPYKSMILQRYIVHLPERWNNLWPSVPRSTGLKNVL